MIDQRTIARMGNASAARTGATVVTLTTVKREAYTVGGKLLAANLGRSLSAEHRAKISAALLGHKHSAETRAKMSKPRSAETRAKMSAARIGKPLSAETRAKMR